ncbi:MAG TPA: SURF1 family protein [Nocardioidaceae bacterium]|nr:SURF1 family protein [Nocardioidaceae bacterium]
MRFVASRRWALFAVTVVVLAYGAYLLGQWQFSRLQERESANSRIRENLRAEPAPVGDVLAPARPAAAADEWRRVTASGRYQPDHSVVIRYQTRDGASGVDIVTPLRTDAGPVLLVDRGWLQTENAGVDRVDAPAPPAGRVRVVGWVRSDATGQAATVTDSSARAISSSEIGRTLDGPVYGGFVDLQDETPAAATPLDPAELPDLGSGPHFFYGLQWWFFGALAVFGLCYLAYDERRRLRSPASAGQASAAPGTAVSGTAVSAPVAHRERSMPPSTGSITPETKPAAGESRNAAAFPNSSGRP